MRSSRKVIFLSEAIIVGLNQICKSSLRLRQNCMQESRGILLDYKTNYPRLPQPNSRWQGELDLGCN
jgi:hypothetical protein